MGIADRMSGSSARGAKFDEIGTTYEGVVVSLEEKQLTEYESDVLETWKNGDPKMTPIYTVKTELAEDADDSGERAIYCRSGLFLAVRDAIRVAWPNGVSDDAVVGSTLKVRFDKTEPGKGNPRKIYLARFTPKAGVAEKQAQGEDDEPPF